MKNKRLKMKKIICTITLVLSLTLQSNNAYAKEDEGEGLCMLGIAAVAVVGVFGLKGRGVVGATASEAGALALLGVIGLMGTMLLCINMVSAVENASLAETKQEVQTIKTEFMEQETISFLSDDVQEVISLAFDKAVPQERENDDTTLTIEDYKEILDESFLEVKFFQRFYEGFMTT